MNGDITVFARSIGYCTCTFLTPFSLNSDYVNSFHLASYTNWKCMKFQICVDIKISWMTIAIYIWFCDALSHLFSDIIELCTTLLLFLGLLCPLLLFSFAGLAWFHCWNTFIVFKMHRWKNRSISSGQSTVEFLMRSVISFYFLCE